MATTVGVLALQGDVAEHLHVLERVGAVGVPVKRAAELAALDGLIIPGGESTTIGKLLVLVDLMAPLRAAIADGLAVYGTCAGAILLAAEALHHDGRPAEQPLIGAMDTTVRRNAFGRQVDSFEADIDVRAPGGAALPGGPMRAVFIRAPAVERVGEGVEVLATVTPGAGVAGGPGDTIVVCRQGRLLASSFHPELTGDTRLHQVFVDMVRG
jgi:5'-phosphate synthase pdxT subunit